MHDTLTAHLLHGALIAHLFVNSTFTAHLFVNSTFTAHLFVRVAGQPVLELHPKMVQALVELIVGGIPQSGLNVFQGAGCDLR
jgi:hypothetical protein